MGTRVFVPEARKTEVLEQMVHVNAALVSAYVSRGGQRLSGMGRERGFEGLRMYQQLSCLNLG